SQLVEDAEVGDPEDPRAEATPRRVERRRLPPDRDEDILDDLLGPGPAERPGGEAEDRRRVAAVERAEGVPLSRGEAAHQLLVAEGLRLRRSTVTVLRHL